MAAGPTAADVLLAPHDLGKSQRTGLIGEGLLPAVTLGVHAALMARGLADRDVGVTLKMDRMHLGAHGYTPRSGSCG